ncbi:MAG: hypothetical protein DRI57_00530 [Deltaproteobacteria bacterium]|nr:MAG: hypothetical protein DRI57_00530 [Deltaproteobacteria bacterium]
MQSFKGKLVMEAGSVILKTEKGKFYPVPYPIQTAISIYGMKRDAVGAYKDYIGHGVTISGDPSDDLIFSARIVRTYEQRGQDDGYGEEYWNNRIPKADILFKARKLPGYSSRFSVDVRQMITVNDSVIHNDLSAHSLLVSDSSGDCNDDIYRIYRHSRVKEINPYHYEYDDNAFGCEFFMYPYELRQLQKGDCDDWGIELASYLISAGIPEWRVRCVAGSTYSGVGHLTVYVLADDLATWYHLNSTTPWWIVEKEKYLKLADFPKAGDSDDKIGIEDVWFSFNNKYAWHTFETHASEEKFQKIPWTKNFKIIPVLE